MASESRPMSVRSMSSPSRPSVRVRKQAPQKTVDDFWDSFSTKYPGKILSILPKNVYAKSKAAREPKGTVVGQAVLKSYDEARTECEAAVQQIARECRRVNMRYRDAHFDIEFDLKKGARRCLDSIWGLEEDPPKPRAVKRVPQIFKKPQFYIDDATAADVRQGKTGDCYLLAAVGALGNKSGLINRVCVARDTSVGVYGFVFHRDGEWIHTIVDDKLYLSVADYDESRDEKSNWGEISNRQNPEQEYKAAFQTGSRALYFAQCNDENETWLPLLEKAYAKAHGDYNAIIGGFTGEAIEDLTGGVTTELFATDILDIDQFWEKELSHVNEDFLFGCATGLFDDWQGESTAWRDGIYAAHAYTIMKAATYEGERLLLVRNPWGQSEWKGRWSDGSEQWTPDSMQVLKHTFGDDGMFWISFEDLLAKYQFFDRTRLFNASWKLSQQWTTVDVPWSADYNETKFTINLTKPSPVVIVLSQLDKRYWLGFEGQYTFQLHFRISKDGEDTYIVRSHGNYWMSRSVSTELDLEAGNYSVLMKVMATRYPQTKTVEQVIRANCKYNQEKLLQVGLAYDLAHAKGTIMETEEDKRHRSEHKARQDHAAKKKALEDAKARKYKDWLIRKKEIERQRREKARRHEHHKKKEAAAKTAANSKPDAGKEQNVKPEEPKESAKEEAAPERKDAEEKDVDQTLEQNGAAKEEPSKGPSAAATDGIPSPADTATVTDKTAEGIVPDKPIDSSELARAKIEEFNSEPALNKLGPTIPALKINEGAVLEAGIPSPPASPGFVPSLGRPEMDDDSETILSFVSSVDSDLDIPAQDTPIDSVDGDSESDPDNEEYSNDPWNAVCVVGLRVYSKEGDVSVGIVRPKVGAGDVETPLDVDDPSKGMSDEPTSPVKEGGSMVESLEAVVAGIEKN